MDVVDSDNESDDDPMSTEMLEDIRDGSQYQEWCVVRSEELSHVPVLLQKC